MVPDYVARQYANGRTHGEIGWGGGIRPAWTYAPPTALSRDRRTKDSRVWRSESGEHLASMDK